MCREICFGKSCPGAPVQRVGLRVEMARLQLLVQSLTFATHLTPVPGLSNTWEAFLGAGDIAHHNHIVEGYYRALKNKILSDLRYEIWWFLARERRTGTRQGLLHPFGLCILPSYRKSVPREMLEAGGGTQAWRATARALLHDLVDEMVDNSDTLGEAVSRLHKTCPCAEKLPCNRIHIVTEVIILSFFFLRRSHRRCFARDSWRPCR